MKMQRVMEIAAEKEVDVRDLNKTELIRAIQRAEGNAECFATGKIDQCSQLSCLWREDCKIALSM